MKDYPATKDNLPRLIADLTYELNTVPSLLVSTSPMDNSLKARQRRLAQVWYKAIAEHLGESLGHAVALCKYLYGLRLITSNNPELESMVLKMLDGYTYEEKLEIIENYSEWFPILRSKGGLSAEDTEIGRAHV